MSYKTHFFKAALNHKGSILTNYKYQIEKHNQFLESMKSCLPDRLSSHALSCVLSNKKISLYTDSAIWSSQLRFYHTTILQTLLNLHPGQVETLQIKVIPKITGTKSQNKVEKKQPPSIKNINCILEAAEQQPEGDLKSALLRLGQHFKKSTTRSID